MTGTPVSDVTLVVAGRSTVKDKEGQESGDRRVASVSSLEGSASQASGEQGLLDLDEDVIGRSVELSSDKGSHSL